MWAYWQRGLYPGGLYAESGIKTMFQNQPRQCWSKPFIIKQHFALFSTVIQQRGLISEWGCIFLFPDRWAYNEEGGGGGGGGGGAYKQARPKFYSSLQILIEKNANCRFFSFFST